MEPRNEILWSIAKKRTAFKRHLAVYVIVAAIFWISRFAPLHLYNRYLFFPWFAWAMFWWGMGLAFSFANAYVFHSSDAINREYEKLKIRN